MAQGHRGDHIDSADFSATYINSRKTEAERSDSRRSCTIDILSQITRWPMYGWSELYGSINRNAGIAQACSIIDHSTILTAALSATNAAAYLEILH
jgi:hypothetical protein